MFFTLGSHHKGQGHATALEYDTVVTSATLWNESTTSYDIEVMPNIKANNDNVTSNDTDKGMEIPFAF